MIELFSDTNQNFFFWKDKKYLFGFVFRFLFNDIMIQHSTTPVTALLLGPISQSK